MVQKASAPDWERLEYDFQKWVIPYVDRCNDGGLEKITMIRDFVKFRAACTKFFGICEINDEFIQFQIVEQLVDLHKAKDEQFGRDALQLRQSQINEWNTAIDVIRSAIKYGESWIGESKDIRDLLEFLQAGIPPVSDKKTLGQVKSSYKERIYQIVEVLKQNSEEDVTVIFHGLNDLLTELYPTGIRRSSSPDAIKKAYQDGKQRSNGTT